MNPSIEPPSNVTRPLIARSSSLTGIVMFFSMPAISTKASRIHFTPRSRAVFMMSRRTFPESLTAESIDGNCGTQGQLIERAVEIEPADLADLAEAIEDRVPVNVELRCGHLDILSYIEEEAKGAHEFGLVFFVVRAQRLENAIGSRLARGVRRAERAHPHPNAAAGRQTHLHQRGRRPQYRQHPRRRLPDVGVSFTHRSGRMNTAPHPFTANPNRNRTAEYVRQRRYRGYVTGYYVTENR
jgi:hypothetical protein